ncbi:MAG: CbiX/SirB N-terminal domain-containing protein [Granulosicoccus sp.]
MKALLLVAHGSRRTESNKEVERLAARLAGKAASRYDIIGPAFLELAAPSIPDAIENCIQQGADSVQVLPYFLACGAHVADDIPQQVAIKQQQYPEVDIRIADYLGTSDEMVDVLLKLID